MSIIKIESNHLEAGLIGGLIAGAVFGAMMGMMGMLPLVAKLLGGGSAVFGFVLHLVFSAIIGIIFSILFGRAARDKTRGVILGLAYGLGWWILGGLIIMPVWLGMGAQLSLPGIQMALPSLGGHLVYGFILGLIYPILVGRLSLKHAV